MQGHVLLFDNFLLARCSFLLHHRSIDCECAINRHIVATKVFVSQRLGPILAAKDDAASRYFTHIFARTELLSTAWSVATKLLHSKSILHKFRQLCTKT
jgi:hypothetical protein